MANLRITLFKAKVLKDGRHRIRIALSHKHHTVYIMTRFVLDSEDEFRNGNVVKRYDASMMNMKLRSLLNVYQERIDKIDYPDSYSCVQIKQLITHEPDETDVYTFSSVCDKYIARLVKDKRNSYASLIDYNRKEFISFANGDLRLSAITPRLIESYKEHLRDKGSLSRATVNAQLGRTRVILNYAVKNGMVRYDVHPFSTTEIPASEPRDCDISIDSLKRIMDFEPTSRKYRVAKDLFLLSFWLGGANLIDLLSMDFSGDYIEYVRTKTRNNTRSVNKTSMKILPCAREIIDRWYDKRTRKLKRHLGYEFTYDNFKSYISRSVSEMCESIGIREHVTFYSARKTFSQIAMEIGCDMMVVNYMLGHSSSSQGIMRYYTKVRRKSADKVLDMVREYVDNPESFD